MHYTLHQLKVFLKIVETKSITQAANLLHLSQPAISIQLKNFQDQFEIPLTEVVGRQLYVTDFGKEISIIAQRIINEVQEIQNKTLAFKGELTGRLTLSVVSTGKYIIPFFLSDFLKSNPGVELSLDVTNKVKVLKSLEKNEVEIRYNNEKLKYIKPEALQAPYFRDIDEQKKNPKIKLSKELININQNPTTYSLTDFSLPLTKISKYIFGNNLGHWTSRKFLEKDEFIFNLKKLYETLKNLRLFISNMFNCIFTIPQRPLKKRGCYIPTAFRKRKL